MYYSLHVQDFYIFSDDKIQRVNEKIGSEMNNFDEIKEITRTKTNICRDQKKYIEQILKRFGIEDSK